MARDKQHGQNIFIERRRLYRLQANMISCFTAIVKQSSVVQYALTDLIQPVTIKEQQFCTVQQTHRCLNAIMIVDGEVCLLPMLTVLLCLEHHNVSNQLQFLFHFNNWCNGYGNIEHAITEHAVTNIEFAIPDHTASRVRRKRSKCHGITESCRP